MKGKKKKGNKVEPIKAADISHLPKCTIDGIEYVTIFSKSGTAHTRYGVCQENLDNESHP
jgi:hypothetical protein